VVASRSPFWRARFFAAAQNDRRANAVVASRVAVLEGEILRCGSE
jgi:hypothetical protein